MDRVFTCNFSDDLIELLSSYLVNNSEKKNDFSCFACVFGGKRPGLFLKRSLARQVKSAFIPPVLFSMDEFISNILAPEQPLPLISDLDAAFLIYSIIQKQAPLILKGREEFNEFLSWAEEIRAFIEQLDIENIDNRSLGLIKRSAEIGYQVPDNINTFLQNIGSIRENYHKSLQEKGLYCRGLLYLQASKKVKSFEFTRFKKVVFCNLYYLSKTEKIILKSLSDRDKAVFFFQGGAEDWSVQKENEKALGFEVSAKNPQKEDYRLSLYKGIDMHAQVGLIREILKNIPDRENTLIVVPRPETIVPLLSEIAALTDRFNVSMGYPFLRTPVYTLFYLLYVSQESRRKGLYYSKDYLNVLKHPLVKNLNLSQNSRVTRILIHKIEEFMQGIEKSNLGGNLFVSLAEIEKERKIPRALKAALKTTGIDISLEECQQLLKNLHHVFFRSWDNKDDIFSFSQNLLDICNILVDKGLLGRFPFNLKALARLYSVAVQMQSFSFARVKFSPRVIWEIVQQRLQSEMVSFSGSPLKGLQILGLFETRSLTFANVIIADVNESVLPKLTVYQPLIPREVMLSLGLNRLEKEEEIQRYHFMRLIKGAKDVHLIYEENQEKEKSRFIEDLLWDIQKKSNSLKPLSVPRAKFNIKISAPSKQVEKTPQMVEFLKKQTYSASRLNLYLNCPLQFYYKYVLGIKEKEDLLEGVEATHIGNFIHELLETTFAPFVNSKPRIDKEFTAYFFDIFNKKFDDEIKPKMRDDSVLLRKIMQTRMTQFLKQESQEKIKRIISLEQNRTKTAMINDMALDFTYTADRIDELPGEKIVILDYKTGSSGKAPKRYRELSGMDMSRQEIKNNIRSFQLPIYYYFISEDFPGFSVNAQLYNLRNLEKTAFFSSKDSSYKKEIMDICMRAVEFIIGELFDVSVPFKPEPRRNRCSYCPYINMCI